MKKSFKIVMALIMVICIMFSQVAFADAEATRLLTASPTYGNNMEYLQSVMNMIKEKYKGAITNEKLMDGALKAMFDKIDEYIKKLTADEANSLLNMLNNTYEGIGVLIEKQGDYVTVIKVFTSSPAEAAGVMIGDKFAEVEGVSVVGASSEDVSSIVKGPVDSKVKVGFIRGVSEKLDMEIIRGKISINPVTYETKGDMGYLQSAMNMLKEKYNGAISDEKLIEGALKGIFGTMDAYTNYFTVDEVGSFFNKLNGSYEGIGVLFEKEGDYVVVTKVFAASPAEAAGVVPGDKLVEIMGVSVLGVSPEEVLSKIKGPEGTKVKVGFIRGTQKIDIEMITKKISISPVTYEIKGDIGYIKLDSFSEDSNLYVTKALAEMDEMNIKKLILDLRDNGGGYVDQVVYIAQNFVPMGLITKLDYKSEKSKDVEYFSYLNEIKYKLAVLVNGESASASEILGGAIQDRAAGTLIGTKTFGKAKVQRIVQLLKAEVFKKLSKTLGTSIVDTSTLESYGIKLRQNEIGGYTRITVGTYTTPNGRMIDLQGLTPDIVVADPEISRNTDVKKIMKLNKKTVLKQGQEGLDVLNAEKILTLSGYSLDAPDFKFDDKTSAALKKFQKDNRLTSNGQLDLNTQQILNDYLENIILNTDKQYAKAIEILNK